MASKTAFKHFHATFWLDVDSAEYEEVLDVTPQRPYVGDWRATDVDFIDDEVSAVIATPVGDLVDVKIFANGRIMVLVEAPAPILNVVAVKPEQQVAPTHPAAISDAFTNVSATDVVGAVQT